MTNERILEADMLAVLPDQDRDSEDPIQDRRKRQRLNVKVGSQSATISSQESRSAGDRLT